MRKILFLAIATLLLTISQILLSSCSADTVEAAPPSANAMTMSSRGVSQTLAE